MPNALRHHGVYCKSILTHTFPIGTCVAGYKKKIHQKMEDDPYNIKTGHVCYVNDKCY